MEAPATINRVSAFGVEATGGERAEAQTKLALLSIDDLRANPEIQEHRVQGEFFASSYTENRNWMTAGVSGGFSFDDAQVPLSSVFGNAEATPLEGGAYERIFEVERDISRIQSYSVYQGDPTLGEAGEADISTNMLFNSFTLSSNRAGEMTVGGDLLGAFTGDDFVAFSEEGVTTLAPVPATPAMLNVYLDESVGDLGNTQVLDHFEGECSIADRYAQRWVHRRGTPSFDQHLPSQPTAQMTAVFSKYSGGGLSDLVRSLRRGQIRYLRFELIGPEISAGVNYTLQWDQACMISEAPEPSDRDGNYISSVTLAAVRSAEWDGRALQVRLINTAAPEGVGEPAPPEGGE